MASAELLPEGLVTKCLDVLRILSSSERDLFMLVVEIVHELRDTVKPTDDDVSVVSPALQPNSFANALFDIILGTCSQ